MAEKRTSQIGDLEALLTAGKPFAQNMSLMRDPETGEPIMQSKMPTEQEKRLAAKLSPNGAFPGDPTQTKRVFVTQQMPVTDEMKYLTEAGIDREKLKSMINRQSSSAEQLDKFIQNTAEQPQDINLKPLAAYIGTMVRGGDKLADAFPEAQSPVERNALLAKLQAISSDKRKDITDQALDLIKAGQDKRSLEIQAQNDRFGRRQDLTMFNTARKEQANLVKDASEFRNQYFNAEDAIQPDANGQIRAGRLSQALSSFARLMGEKGVLTDTDIGRQLAPTWEALQAKVATWATSDPNTLVDASVANSIRDALKTAKEAYRQKYEMQRSVFQSTYFDNPDSPYAGRGWSEQMIRDLDKPLELIDSKAQKTETQQADPDAVLAEMKRRGL